MKMILGAPRTGKTLALIKMADGFNGYIVCANRQEVKRVCRRAGLAGYHINMPITADEFFRGKYGEGLGRVYIDNLDLILERLTRHGAEVAAATASGSFSLLWDTRLAPGAKEVVNQPSREEER